MQGDHIHDGRKIIHPYAATFGPNVKEHERVAYLTVVTSLHDDPIPTFREKGNAQCPPCS